MKIKGVIKNLNSKNFTSDNSQNISSNFSGAVWVMWGQFRFRQLLVPACACSPQDPSNAVNVNYRVLTCCTRHIQRRSVFFILGSSICKSLLQCLISTLTQEAKVVTYLGSHVQLCCGEGGTQQTNITGMCGESSQCMHHQVCPCSRQRVPPGSTLLRLQGDPGKDLNDLDNITMMV